MMASNNWVNQDAQKTRACYPKRYTRIKGNQIMRLLNAISICILYFSIFSMVSCGGGSSSDETIQSNSQNPEDNVVFELSDLPVEYSGEMVGTLSGVSESDYKQKVTLLYTPKRQYYLTTLTMYFGENRENGEAVGLLKEDESEYGLVYSSADLLPGNFTFQIVDEDNLTILNAYGGTVIFSELSPDKIKVNFDLSMEGLSPNGELIQKTLTGSVVAAKQAPTLHTISDLNATPTSPNNLLVQDVVTIELKYKSIEEDGVRIWNTPSVNGGSYSTNASPVYPSGSGIAQVSFQVYSVSTDVAKVDSTFIYMVSGDRKRVLAGMEMPLDYNYFQ